jgi:hypothetical protein
MTITGGTDGPAGTERRRRRGRTGLSTGSAVVKIERVRATTGLIAVVAGDTAIAIAAILGILHFPPSVTQASQNLSQFVAILSSAFTAIGTLTTAYFGIKSISNVAQALGQQPSNGQDPAAPAPAAPAPAAPAPADPAPAAPAPAAPAPAAPAPAAPSS